MMMLKELISQNSNEMMMFGETHEALAILIFAILLIATTVGIRWFLKKHDNKTNSKSGETEA